jgi:hypothetical protein
MRLSATYLLASLAVGCGVGVESSPGTPLAMPATGECDAPQGPLHHYTTASEVETLIVGRWRHCSGPTMIAGSDGVEFVADHSYFALVDNGLGNLVRTTGFGNEGTWEAYQQNPTWVQFAYRRPGAGNGGTLEFEDGPPRFSIPLATSNEGPSIYVGAGP